MWRVDARDLDLPRGELKQLAPTTVAHGRDETVRREMNREFCFLEYTRDREIVRDSAAPAIADVEPLKSSATDRS
jgi:hypothetical protein